MRIQTERLWIRPFVFADLNDVNEYCVQKEAAENAGWAAHQSRKQSAEILNSWMLEGKKQAIVLLETNKVIGHIAVDPDSEEGRIDTRELGCVLNAKYHRRGIMSEAIGEVIDYLFFF